MRVFCILLLATATLLFVSMNSFCNSSNVFDSEISDKLLMVKSGTPQISEIESVAMYSLENERSWPAYNELNAKSLFWERKKKSDIEKCIVKLRTHSEGSAPSKKSSKAYVVKIKLKDRRIGLIKIIEYPNILYVIPYPKKSEFGVHGFFNNAFFDILKGDHRVKRRP